MINFKFIMSVCQFLFFILINYIQIHPSLMKQSQKIIKKGDYYELQIAEDAMFSKAAKKDQNPISTSHQVSQNIITDLPSHSQARKNYYIESKIDYKSKDIDDLVYELQNMLKENNLKDQDKQEILKILKEVRNIKGEEVLTLNELTKLKAKQVSAPQNKITLTAQYDLKQLERQVNQLEKLSYPQLSKLEHQLEILLGEKKITSHVPQAKDQRSKQEMDNLFAHLSGLNCVNDLTGIINRIHLNNDKYVEMSKWANQLQSTMSLNSDFLSELKEDENIINQLEVNFQKNIKKIKYLIQNLKNQAGK